MSPSSSRLFALLSRTVELAGTTGSSAALGLGVRSRRAEAQSVLAGLIGLLLGLDAQHETPPRLRRIAGFERVDVDGIVALGGVADGQREVFGVLVLDEPSAAAAPTPGGKVCLGGESADDR